MIFTEWIKLLCRNKILEQRNYLLNEEREDGAIKQESEVKDATIQARSSYGTGIRVSR